MPSTSNTLPETPKVSVIIPCRNEERYIDHCISSLLRTNYPVSHLEILIVDGSSTDGTKTKLASLKRKHPIIQILDNPKKVIPVAMNIGIAHSTGDIVLKVDAHSTYPENYIAQCVKFMIEYQADNIGGHLSVTPSSNTIVAKSIAIVLSSKIGSGYGSTKTKVSVPTWTDSVGFGCYKRSMLDKIGFYNEALTRGSDMDLNNRLRSNGGRILKVPEITVNYYTKSTLGSFWNHNFSDGYWVTYPLALLRTPFTLRHLIPLAFVTGVAALFLSGAWNTLFLFLGIAILAFYVLVISASSAYITITQGNPLYFPILCMTFFTRHIAYGIGSMFGLIAIPCRCLSRLLRNN